MNWTGVDTYDGEARQTKQNEMAKYKVFAAIILITIIIPACKFKTKVISTPSAYLLEDNKLYWMVGTKENKEQPVKGESLKVEPIKGESICRGYCGEHKVGNYASAKEAIEACSKNGTESLEVSIINDLVSREDKKNHNNELKNVFEEMYMAIRENKIVHLNLAIAFNDLFSPELLKKENVRASIFDSRCGRQKTAQDSFEAKSISRCQARVSYRFKNYRGEEFSKFAIGEFVENEHANLACKKSITDVCNIIKNKIGPGNLMRTTATCKFCSPTYFPKTCNGE